MLAISALSDRNFYQAWVFPPWRFLQFNVAQDLAVFYGRNRPDYYLTEGLPLMLMSFLPFSLVAVAKALLQRADPKDPAVLSVRKNALFILSVTAITTVTAFSLISHKEVRFVYPLLPALHILAAGPATDFFRRKTVLKRFILNTVLLANVGIALYLSLVHQRGVIDVMAHLRQQHENPGRPQRERRLDRRLPDAVPQHAVAELPRARRHRRLGADVRAAARGPAEPPRRLSG